jgi:colicin import membrane protein
VSATVYYEPNKLPAGILALVVHSVFFALLYIGFNWNRQAVSAPATMSVELWPSLPEEVIAPPVNPKVEEVVQPPPQEKIVEPDIVMPEKKKVAAKPVAAKPVVTKPVATKPVATKPVATKPEKKKPVPVTVEVTKTIPKPDTQKPAEHNPDTRIADQQAASAQAERIKQDEQAAAKGRMVDEYMAKIQAKIRRNVVMPPDVAKDANGLFSVTLLPGGAVLKAELKKSSGNAAYDTAVERAILKSDPLPLPPDAQLFNRFRELNLPFHPGE